jgi:soluble lytic murein transglycosylase-like protein
MTAAALTALFLAATATYHLPKGLLPALCFVESHFDTGAINPDDRGGPSRGVCQVQERTARFLGFTGTVEQLMDPRTNIKYAARYLRYQLRRYQGDVVKAVAAYNSGSYLEAEDGLPVNRGYVVKVLRAHRERR